MQPIMTVTAPAPEEWTPADILSALELAAKYHSYDLNIHFDRMYNDFGALWMIVRCRYTLTRQPKGDLTVRTWLRTPSPALSLRDFDLEDAEGHVGEAVQTWVVVDAKARQLISLKQIPAMWELPIPQPERVGSLRNLRLPDLPVAARWTVDAAEIDANGHLNNVKYVRHAQTLVPAAPLGLEIIYDRECFAGETLTLEAADGYVRGVKPDGSESFRARFRSDV